MRSNNASEGCDAPAASQPPTVHAGEERSPNSAEIAAKHGAYRVVRVDVMGNLHRPNPTGGRALVASSVARSKALVNHGARRGPGRCNASIGQECSEQFACHGAAGR